MELLENLQEELREKTDTIEFWQQQANQQPAVNYEHQQPPSERAN